MNLLSRHQKFRHAYEKALAGNWKGGLESISKHLERRKARGHLPSDATEADLIQKGIDVLNSSDAMVYEYAVFKGMYFIVYQNGLYSLMKVVCGTLFFRRIGLNVILL